ncbi:MAG: DUF2256 domain-containing protein [Chitinophagaceae bacterium]
MTHKGNKSFLAQKICITCGRSFVWRKKWKKVWAEVKYCSNRCSGIKKLTLPTQENK